MRGNKTVRETGTERLRLWRRRETRLIQWVCFLPAWGAEFHLVKLDLRGGPLGWAMLPPGVNGVRKYVISLQVTVFWRGGSQVGIIGLVQQLCEESPRQVLGREGVLQKPLRCWSLLGILGQGKLEEVMEILGPASLVSQLWRLEAALRHKHQGPHGMQVEERRLQLAQLDGSDAQGPDVTQLIVATFALHGGHLWGHPVWSPNERPPLGHRRCQLA